MNERRGDKVLGFGFPASLGLSRIGHTTERLAHRALRGSSVRSAMFIVKLHRGTQAPLGAACRLTPLREPDMPLLTELEHHLLGALGYKHGAPNGANLSARWCALFGLKAGRSTTQALVCGVLSILTLLLSLTPCFSGVSAQGAGSSTASTVAATSPAPAVRSDYTLEQVLQGIRSREAISTTRLQSHC
jgi:hypothetical protein